MGRSSYYTKLLFGFILLLATAAVFLFSGISKIFTIEEFTWNVMDAGISHMGLAGITARLFIGFEILLGVFLLAHLYLRSFTYPAIVFLLVLFCVYLLLLMLRQGNEGNCGCFGEVVHMRPSEALLKNVVMILTTLLLGYLYPSKPYKFSRPVALITGALALGVPFIISPPWVASRPESVNQPIDLSPLYKPGVPHPSVELRKDKHIVAFMSLTCGHCRKAAFLLQVIHRQNPDLPIFMVLHGPPELQSEFFHETHSGEVPHLYFRSAPDFAAMAGRGVPAIYWINEGVIEKKSSYFQLDPALMRSWLRE